jgi:hypothetical protein
LLFEPFESSFESSSFVFITSLLFEESFFDKSSFWIEAAASEPFVVSVRCNICEKLAMEDISSTTGLPATSELAVVVLVGEKLAMEDISSTTGLPATSELAVVVLVDSKKFDSLDTSSQPEGVSGSACRCQLSYPMPTI